MHQLCRLQAAAVQLTSAAPGKPSHFLAAAVEEEGGHLRLQKKTRGAEVVYRTLALSYQRTQYIPQRDNACRRLAQNSALCG